MTTGPTDAGAVGSHDEFTGDAAAELEGAVEHINENHPDTVLLVARFAAGAPDAVAASIGNVLMSGAEIDVRRADGTTGHVTLGFGQRRPDLGAAYQALMSSVAAARAAAGDGVPLTSMERELADQSELERFVTEVVAREQLTPTLMAVTFRGGLERFPSRGGDQYVALVPNPPDAVLADSFALRQLREMPEAQRPPAAAYTVRRWRREAGEIDMWFVVHAHGGSVSGQLAAARPGTPVAFWGPRHTYDPPDGTTSHLLVADETALAAVASILDGLPPDHPATVVAETVDPDHRVDLPGGDAVTVHWVYRGTEEPGSGTRLVDTVRDLAPVTEGLYAFAAGEAGQVRDVRRHLRRELGLPVAQAHLSGYWRRRPQSSTDH